MLKIFNILKLQKWKKEGLVIGKNFKMEKGVMIDPSFPWLVKIGDNVTIAPYVSIMAHDGSTKSVLGYSKIALTSIGNNVFIGSKSIVLAGVTVGDDVIIAAGSVVTKNIPSGSVVAGVPAKIVKSLNDFTISHKKSLLSATVYDKTYTKSNRVSTQMKEEMVNNLKSNNNSYII